MDLELNSERGSGAPRRYAAISSSMRAEAEPVLDLPESATSLAMMPSPAERRQVIWPQAPRSVYFELAEIQPRCQPSLSVHHQAR